MPKQQNPWPSLEPGKLRHRVQIQQQSATPDAYGQPQLTWTTILTTWSQIQVVTQRELYQSGALTSQVTHTITMRWPSVSISAGMRVVFGSHIYQIQAPNNIEERNVILKLMCLEPNGAE